MFEAMHVEFQKLCYYIFMNIIKSEKELLETFRQIDREEVIFSKELSYPLRLEDYFTWIEPSGNRVYLIKESTSSNLPFGIVFRRDQSTGGPSAMCEWCHAVRSGSDVSLLTATSSSQRRVGIYLCRDLSCKEKAVHTPNPDDVPRFNTAGERIQAIMKRMDLFAKKYLF